MHLNYIRCEHGYGFVECPVCRKKFEKPVPKEKKN